jgi:hypothetical protein
VDNKTFLIPANTKKGQLIFNVFTPFDLILFSAGVGVTFILLMTVGASSVLTALVVLLPGLICGFLVLPIPNYHNVLTFFKSMFNFLTNQRMYMWKGWCFYESTKD